MPPVRPLFVLFACVQAVLGAESAGEQLTSAKEVLALPADRAESGIGVTIEGVVTAAQPDWGGRFFVQDPTAGIFVEFIGDRHPDPGDLVRVTGVSHPGGFAPIITQPSWEKLGTAPLPAARPVPIERLMAGIEDSQRVEISGTVRTVRVDEFALVFHLMSGGFRLQAIAPPGAIADPQTLVGAKLRLRGTAAATFKPELRQVITVNLFVPVADDLVVERLDPHDPFKERAILIRELAQYRPDGSAGGRVRVRGTVTHRRPGEDIFISDGSGGLQIKSGQPISVEVGETVEAVGFPDLEYFLPVLQDAVLRKTGETSEPVVAKRVNLQELQASYYHADLVTLRGKLVDSTVRGIVGVGKGSPPERVTLTLQTPEFVFTAEGPTTESNAGLAGLLLGSTLELTGICMLHVADDGQMESLQLLLPGVGAVRVIEEPSWLTPKRLLTGLGLLSGVLLLTVGWIATVSRKNLTLKTVIRDKVHAQDQLQQAHDMLEGRVRERTAQLKHEANERKEAEVRFKATLAERTRLAQELHDTTEQSLTGISLQLDTAAKLLDNGDAGARRPLDLARTLMSRSHLELRRSIWDLRSRELEQFDLPNALEMSAREILQGTDVGVKFETTGRVRPLSEVVEENLLRIGREAVANVIKHAGAQRVELTLGFGAQSVTLRVRDDGCGFDPAGVAGSEEGHFGLLGMSERAKQLNGKFRVTSSPGSGTLIEVEIPFHPAQEGEPSTDMRGHI